MTILNLGCGTKTSADPAVLNIDWSIYARLQQSRILRPLVPMLLDEERRRRFEELTGDVIVHNLAKGIPAADRSVDAVYHSHLLEHLDRGDRDVAVPFVTDVRRVLRPGGIHRIVVPDLEHVCREYLDHLEGFRDRPVGSDEHDRYVGAIIGQSVRREAYGTSTRPRIRRFVENRLLGDARKRGETHQWMYDWVNLSALLTRCGFREIRRVSFDVSSIPDWSAYGLDRNADGSEYKPGSLYVEAVAP